MVRPLDAGKPVKIEGPAVLLSETRPNAVPVAFLEKPATVELLAQFENYSYVRTESGLLGWLEN